jgi:pseudouridine synthase
LAGEDRGSIIGKIRLHQFLSKCGYFSSKEEVKQAIWSGDITVNGKITKHIAFEFNPSSRIVMYRGIELKLPETNIYFLLNKPVGCICSRLNSHERELEKKSVYELFRSDVSASVYESLVTVGRLDEDTTGLLLVTSDGHLVNRITKPENKVNKSYKVDCYDLLSESQLVSLREGVEVVVNDHGSTETYRALPAIVEIEHDHCAIVTITEGKKRQIRRMFTSIGNEVKHLHRLSTEGMILSDYNLNPGEYCSITLEDIERLIFTS